MKDVMMMTNLNYGNPYGGDSRTMSKTLVVGGDFNVLNEEEKQGGLPFLQQQALDFTQCIQNCGLVEIKYSGNNSTWWKKE